MWKRYIPFRLSVAVPVLVILVLLLALLMSPLARSVAESGASAALGTEVRFASLSISPLTRKLTFTELTVQDRDRPGENLLVAQRGEGNLSLYELLRGRAVFDEILLSGVRVHVQRNEDGTFNVENIGRGPEEKPPPSEDTKEEAKKTDWVKTIRKVAEKLKEWREKKDKEEKDRKEGRQKKPPPDEIADGRATYIHLEEPRLLIRRIRIEELEVELSDKSKEKELPPITKGTVTIENVSSAPLHTADPIRFSLGGTLGDQGVLDLGGLLDLCYGRQTAMDLALNGNALDLNLLEPVFGVSLPVELRQGRGDVRSKLQLADFSVIDLLQNVALREVEIAPDGKHDTLFGVPADRFCAAVNRAKTLAIEGLKITGTLTDPEFQWNRDFFDGLSGIGIEVAAGELEKYLGTSTSKLRKEAEKALGSKLGGEATKKVEGAIKDGLDLFRGLGTDKKKP